MTFGKQYTFYDEDSLSLLRRCVKIMVTNYQEWGKGNPVGDGYLILYSVHRDLEGLAKHVW